MSKFYRSLLAASLFTFLGTAMVFAQGRTVSGTVTDETGNGLPGVNIIIKGSATGTTSDMAGNFSLAIPSDNAVLVFSFVGYATSEAAVGARTVVNVQLSPDVRTLQELVVTGYTSERKADIIGSVAVVKSADLMLTPSSNLSQQLQGRASGVVSSGAGAPGEGAKVRIRGFTSFGSSDPLYIIDGVPTSDASRVNPNDVESVQVLKDATSASIYGARAAQGVIIVTTKQGKRGTTKVTYDTFFGSNYIPTSYEPELLNTQEYIEYLNRQRDPSAASPYSHPVFGTAGSFAKPDFIVVSTMAGNTFKGGFNAGAPQVDPSLYYLDPNNYSQIYQIMETSSGTNWHDEITRKAFIQSHQITASGGTDRGTFSLGLNYFDQEGVYQYSGYDRYALRLNSSFNANDWLRVGENFQLIRESFQNATGNGARGEASAWAQAFRMVPYIPVQDIAGGWGGNGVGESGNGTNPVAQLYRAKDNEQINYKLLGNVWGEITPVTNLVFRTSFGMDYGNFFTKSITPRTYERSENVAVTALGQSYVTVGAWTWTNTLTYTKEVAGGHSLKFLAGTEAIKANIVDGITTGNINTFDFEDPLFVSLNTDQSVSPLVGDAKTTPARTLVSYFGRVDYTYKDKYLFNATIRRDGSSVFGSENRWGTFPAFGVGWRVSEESFFSGIDFISDLKLRAGWGQMGSERNVNPLNQYPTFRFNPGYSGYDINRNQTGAVAIGYVAFNAGSNTTKWEQSETTNIGLDASLTGGWDVSLNWFNTNTNDLIVGRPRPALGGLLQYPAINFGQMRNRGFEFEVMKRGNINPDLSYSASVVFTHYKNTAIDLDGNPETFFARNASRLNNVWRTQAGQPVSSFYGYQLDGFFQNQAEVDALDQPGAIVGSWRYKDLDGNGVINDNDRTFIGNPQPDFVLGFNLGIKYKQFDLTGFFVWNYGNELFNYTKYWTDMRVFVGGVSKDVLYDSWTPEKPSGTLPFLGYVDGDNKNDGYSDFIRSTSSDFYLESGSYFRARTLQLGYRFAPELMSKLKLQNARVYLQGENLFTITNYSGPDPDISIQGNDLQMGLDDAAFPNPRQILVGLSITF